MAQKILTKAIEKKLPALYSQEAKPANETRIYLKLFNPYGVGRWYATEYDPASGLCFGYVTGLGHDELGSFSLDELKALRVPPFGLPIERDAHWDDKITLQQVMDGKEF